MNIIFIRKSFPVINNLGAPSSELQINFGVLQIDTENSASGLRSKMDLTEKRMFFLSWLTALGSGMGSVCLITETDSPERGKEEIIHLKVSKAMEKKISNKFEGKLTSQNRLINPQSCGKDFN